VRKEGNSRMTVTMKSNLSQILPTVEACSILGHEAVERTVRSFLAVKTPKAPPTTKDVEALIKYMAVEGSTTTDGPASRWIKRGMDKRAFISWSTASHAQPVPGAGGHMGLFDCWAHALSSAANNYSTAGSQAPVVLLPDFIIAVAVCREYRAAQLKGDTKRWKYALMMMAEFGFRVYDSHLKKGVVTRDTIHRFLSDVHGDDSYKTTGVRRVLDHFFNPEGSERTLLSLTAAQFTSGILNSKMTAKSHILLDWLAAFGTQMIPLHPLPHSTEAYLETIQQSHRSVEDLCEFYSLASLYEIKRRFHSLVEHSQVLHGDVLVENADYGPKQKKPHVISMNAFYQAVTMENEEGGHGGFLPRALAELVFQTASLSIDMSVDDNNFVWGLYDVLQFGVDAVRQSKKQRGDIIVEIPLLRFVFRVFGGSKDGNRCLSRAQIGEMLLLLLEHGTFRLQADSPRVIDEDEDEETTIQPFILNDSNFEDTLVDVTAASLLGLLPSKLDGKVVMNGSSKKVSLETVIEFCLEVANSDVDGLTFDSFCRWHYNHASTDLAISQRRVGPLMMDLRLIAAIIFGIPPSKASMELTLMEEVQRRHKYRYPQSDVSRRGPRGTVWYILDDRWFRHWVAHVKKVGGTEKDAMDERDTLDGNARGLGKINNTCILAENGSLALRADIRWRTDYEIIPPLSWSALQAWYDGGPPISRSVVRFVPSNGPLSPHSKTHRLRTEHEIELYPFFVTVFLCDVTSKGEARPFQQSSPLSRVSPVRVLLIQLCKGLGVDPKYGRLWMMEGDPEIGGGDDWLLNLDENIVEQRTRRGSIHDSPANIMLLLELKDLESMLWPRGLDGKNWTFKDQSKDIPGLGADSEIGDGIVGLYNMGNTCYLNSSVQCLSHTPVFRDYFTTKAYLNDINTTNPIGHQGRVAQVTAVLVNSLWKRFNNVTPHQPRRITAPGSYAPVNAPALTPKTFKDALGKCNEHFSGNEQHDAQELLAFLLGGLSEDLNLIVEKPYIEAPDSDGRPDSELADIWWSNHLKREMSIIVSMFTGQYKSLLTCRSCKYESARFEPFTFLQLPLPEDDQVAVSLIYYPIGETMEALKYSVRVKHDGKLSDLLIALSKVIYLDLIGTNGCEEGDKQVASGDKDNGDDDDEEQDEAKNAELDAIFKKMSQNMAVVDMREGYIFKIAPNSWALPDLQSKDTGELPLLHVYALDPLVELNGVVEGKPRNNENGDIDEIEQEDLEEGIEEDDDESDEVDCDKGNEDEEGPGNEKFHSSKNIEEDEEPLQGNDTDDDDDDESKVPCSSETKHSFLAIAQRKSEVLSRELLHPFTHRVFGTPLLLRVNDLEGYSGSDLYDLVAQRLRKFVPNSALRFLERAEHEVDLIKDTDSRVEVTHGNRQRRRRTLSEMEEVAAGPVPRYGFRLRLATRDGRRCALCPWYQCCIGCLIPDDDSPTIVLCGDSIALDWHFAVDIATAGFGLRLNQLDQPVSTSPFRARNPSTIHIKNHASCNDEAKKKGYGGTITLEDCLDAFAKEEKIPEAYCSKCKDFRVQTKRMSLWRLPPVVIIHLKRFQFTQHMRRKLRDLVVFPVEGLDLSRIVATDTSKTLERREVDDEALLRKKAMSNLSDDDAMVDDTTACEDDESTAPMGPFNSTGRAMMLYDLYAVVHHQGALSGGHYVASLKSDDGQWRLFNDAQVYEIHSRDVIDSSAYILFYVRRDVKDAKLQDFWDLRKREGEGLTEEEVEKLMKAKSDRCVIS